MIHNHIGQRNFMLKPSNKRVVSLWDDYDQVTDTITLATTTPENEPEPAPKTSGEISLVQPRLVAIKELTKLYGLKLSAIYGLIKTDSSFPAVNLGLKKKYMIDLNEFNKWLEARNKKEKQARSNEPTSDDLLKVFREKKK